MQHVAHRINKMSVFHMFSVVCLLSKILRKIPTGESLPSCWACLPHPYPAWWPSQNSEWRTGPSNCVGAPPTSVCNCCSWHRGRTQWGYSQLQWINWSGSLRGPRDMSQEKGLGSRTQHICMYSLKKQNQLTSTNLFYYLTPRWSAIFFQVSWICQVPMVLAMGPVRHMNNVVTCLTQSWNRLDTSISHFPSVWRLLKRLRADT